MTEIPATEEVKEGGEKDHGFEASLGKGRKTVWKTKY
jgi:hypothetical protein